MATSGRCSLCDRKGRRNCPARSAPICAACCGDNRNARIECPPGCAFNPFGTEAYDAYLRIEATAIQKCLVHLSETRTFEAFHEALKRYDCLLDAPEDLPLCIPFAIQDLLTRPQPDGAGTAAERMEAEGWPGMTKDERFFIARFLKSRFTFMEVMRIVAPHELLCQDLLEPGSPPFPVFDKSLASRAVRFGCFLAFLTELPHFRRPLSVSVEIPFEIARAYVDRFRKEADDAARERPGTNPHEHLRQNLRAWVGAMHEMGRASRRRLAQSMDARLHAMTFDIAGDRREVEKILADRSEFLVAVDDENAGTCDPPHPPGSVRFDWVFAPGSEKIEAALQSYVRTSRKGGLLRILGTLWLEPDRVSVEVFGDKKRAYARERITQRFGTLLSFREQTTRDLAMNALQRLPVRRRWNEAGPFPEDFSPDLDGMIPRAGNGADPGFEDEEWDGEERDEDDGRPGPPRSNALRDANSRDTIQAVFAEHYRDFADIPLPALDGKTPRQASTDPAMRPRLVDLMKLHIHGLEGRRIGGHPPYDLSALLEELGLNELA